MTGRSRTAARATTASAEAEQWWQDHHDRGGPQGEDRKEGDGAVLDLMLPHLRQLRCRAARRHRTATSADGLTPRQREVLTLVARGMTNEQVARTLWIATGTVRKHLDNAYEKLGVRSRAAAVAALRPER